MLAPAFTGSGESTFVTARSAWAVVVVLAVAKLSLASGSTMSELALAVFMIVEPLATDAATFTTSEKLDALELACDAFVHDTVPDAPTTGVVQLQPPGDASDTNVVFAGRLSVSVEFVAASGPLLVTPME